MCFFALLLRINAVFLSCFRERASPPGHYACGLQGEKWRQKIKNPLPSCKTYMENNKQYFSGLCFFCLKLHKHSFGESKTRRPIQSTIKNRWILCSGNVTSCIFQQNVMRCNYVVCFKEKYIDSNFVRISFSFMCLNSR